MAKQKDTAAEMLGEAEGTQETGLAVQHDLTLLDMLAEQDNSALRDINAGEFLSIKENETHVFFFTGVFEEVESKLNAGQKQECAVLIGRDGRKKLNSQAVLVSSLKKIRETVTPWPENGVPVKVVSGEKVKGNNGRGPEYLKMKVLY